MFDLMTCRNEGVTTYVMTKLSDWACMTDNRDHSPPNTCSKVIEHMSWVAKGVEVYASTPLGLATVQLPIYLFTYLVRILLATHTIP